MNLKIEPERIKCEVNKMIYGHFIEHFHRQIYGGVYDPKHPLADEDGFRTDVLEAMRRIKTPVLRWPGGCFVSAYHWKDGVGSERRPMFDKAWRVEEPNEFGTDEYIKLCRKIGCEPYICTNAGTGSKEEMSDWVEYCNLKEQGYYSRLREKNGCTEPYRVKYWSIGNENYGEWEIGARTSSEWGYLVRESAKMMKHTDPTIELSAAALVDMDWNVELLKRSGSRLSWISLHTYWDFHKGRNELQGYESCMAYTQDLEKPVRQIRGLLSAMDMEHIKIAYDEWNLRGWYHPNTARLSLGVTPEEYLYPRDENDKNSQYTMADAVFAACFLNMCIRNGDIVGMANFSPVVNTRGMIYTCEEGIVLRSVYHVFDAYVNGMWNQCVDFWDMQSPVVFRVRDENGEEKDVDALDVAVTANETGDKISLGVVNKHPFEAETISLHIAGLTQGRYRLITVNGPSVDSYNSIEEQKVKKVEQPWTDFTGQITLMLEPHSVNVIQCER